MAEKDNENKIESQPDISDQGAITELDPASKSLSEALRLSFVLLKIIMVVLLIIFLASGFRTVESGERALVLRFGKVQGTVEKRLLEPGLHWVLPYPIDKVVKIPVGQVVTLPIDSFWYFQTKDEILSGSKRRVRPDAPLKPMMDGYCITRSQEYDEMGGHSDGSDYNILHCKWEMTYKVGDEQAERFFRNVYVKEPKPGEDYTAVIAQSVNPLLESLVEDAVVTSLVSFTIEEVKESVAAVTSQVRGLIQKKLDTMETGLEVVSLQLNESTWPRQVNEAFDNLVAARQASDQAMSEAKASSSQTLNEAGGPVAEELWAALKDDSVSQEQREALWASAAGEAREKIAEARAYRTEVVETAKANADYLKHILPEYRKYPELVLQSLYLDAMEYIFGQADEIFAIQPGEDVKSREIRVLINRDPTIKPDSEGDDN
jgi:membrane protease subunit HflK